MEKQKAIDLVIKLLKAQGLKKTRLNLETKAETDLVFVDLRKSSLYLVDISPKMRTAEEAADRRENLLEVMKKGMIAADRLFLLYLILDKPGGELPLPDLESDIIEIYWYLDADKEKLMIPSGQMTSFLELERTLPEVLVSQTVEDYVMHRPRRYPYLTYALIALNILIWLWQEASGGSEQTEVLLRMGAMNPLLILSGEWYRLLTAVFLHIGWLHLLMNLAGLFIFGSRLERKISAGEMALIYLGGGIVGNLASLLYHWLQQDYQVIGAGASGGIYALMGALLTVTYLTKKRAGGLDAYAIFLYFIIGLAAGAANMQIDLAAHLGGFALGFLLAVPFTQRRKVQLNDENDENGERYE